MDSSALRALAFAAGGWLSAAACVLASAWHVRRLSRHEPPSLDETRVAFARVATDSARELLRAELRERRADAERALSLATLLPRSLSRVALATGTALALTNLAKGLPVAGVDVVTGATLGFLGGFAGMIGCAAFGRQAKAQASEMRKNWKRVVQGVVR